MKDAMSNHPIDEAANVNTQLLVAIRCLFYRGAVQKAL